MHGGRADVCGSRLPSDPPAQGAGRGHRRGRAAGIPPFGLLGVAALLLIFSLSPARAEDRLRVQGLADAEIWNTGVEPDTLERKEGEAAGLGRLRLWAVGTFMDGLQGFALVRAEGGDASSASYSGVTLEQAYLRFSPPGGHRIVVQAGRLYLPYGNFSRRYLSVANPLIGNPILYELSYPLGIQINGAAGRWDYMASVVDEPLTREDYGSDYKSTPRPAVASGVTVITGLRLGAYATRGPYLSRIAETWLLPGKTLEDYHESVLGGDLEYSVGHFELNGEVVQTRLEVPAAGNARGRAWYVEPKYTFTPRWYAAMRWERGESPRALWLFGPVWSAGTETIHGLEAGAGFRMGPDLLLKATVRTERTGDPAGGESRGTAVALQLSYRFDVNSWFERLR